MYSQAPLEQSTGVKWPPDAQVTAAGSESEGVQIESVYLGSVMESAVRERLARLRRAVVEEEGIWTDEAKRGELGCFKFNSWKSEEVDSPRPLEVGQ